MQGKGGGKKQTLKKTTTLRGKKKRKQFSNPTKGRRDGTGALLKSKEKPEGRWRSTMVKQGRAHATFRRNRPPTREGVCQKETRRAGAICFSRTDDHGRVIARRRDEREGKMDRRKKGQ